MSNVKTNAKAAKSLTDRTSLGNKVISVALSVVLLGFGWPAVNPAEVYAEDGAPDAAQTQPEGAQADQPGASENAGSGAAEGATPAEGAAGESAATGESADKLPTVEEAVSNANSASSADSASGADSANGAQAPAAEQPKADGESAAADDANGQVDVALSFANASMKYNNQTVTAPTTKLTLAKKNGAVDALKFTVEADNGYKLADDSVKLSVAGAAETAIAPDASGEYTVSSDDVLAGASIAISAEKDAASPENGKTNGTTAIENTEGKSNAESAGSIDKNAAAEEQAKEEAINQGTGAFADILGNLAKGDLINPANELSFEKGFAATYYLAPGESVTIPMPQDPSARAVVDSEFNMNGENDAWSNLDRAVSGSNGVITAKETAKEAEYTVYWSVGYSYSADPWYQQRKTTYKIIVGEEPSLSVSPSKLEVNVGESSTDLEATVTPATATVTWSSEDPSIATVDSATGEVTGVKVGSTTITAKSNSGKTATVAVDVAMAGYSNQTAYFYLECAGAALNGNSYSDWLYAGTGTVYAPSDAEKGTSLTIGEDGFVTADPTYFLDKTIKVNDKTYVYDASGTHADGTYSIAWGNKIKRTERSSDAHKWANDPDDGSQTEWLTESGSLDWHVDGTVTLNGEGLDAQYTEQDAYFYLARPDSAVNVSSTSTWLYAGKGTVKAPVNAKKGTVLSSGVDDMIQAAGNYYADKSFTIGGVTYTYDADGTKAAGTYSVVWDVMRLVGGSTNSNKWDGEEGGEDRLTPTTQLDWHVDGHIVLNTDQVNSKELAIKSAPQDVEYNGEEHKWTPEVIDARTSDALKATDYAVTYSTEDFVNPGVVTATISGEGDYANANKLTATYTINHREDTQYEKWISVGQSKTIDGTTSVYSGSNWRLDGSDNGVIEFTSNGDSATVKGLKVGTVKLVHGYYKSWRYGSWTTETYTIHVSKAQPAKSVSISGDDSVTQFASTQLSAATDPTDAVGTYTWASSNEDILTVDNDGNVTGVRQGTATVTVTFTSAADGSTVTASKDVTVKATTTSTDQAQVYYLLDPTKDANSNDSGNWGPEYGEATVNLNGATWTNDKNCFDNVDQRVVSWPNGTNVVPRGSDAWNEIFNNYKSTIQAQLPGIDFTKDDVEEIALVPAKISKDNGTTPDKHLDCNVTIKCKNVSLVKYYLRDAGSTQFEQKGSKSYVSGSTTQPSDVINEQFPATKTVDGVTYTFSGWYLDQNFTQPVTFPYTVNGSTNFYAKYVGGFQVIYDLGGGTWGNSDATMYGAQEGSTQTVKSEPTREGYKFTGWTVEGLPDTATLNSGDTFTMPAGNVTITANWQKLESYVVKYQEVGTEVELADSVTRYGEKGQTSTEHAKTIDGYHLSNCPDAIEHTFGEGDGTVIFWYEKDAVNYTVNYYLNNTEQKVADSETKSAAWGSTVKASDLVKDISGYTVVPGQDATITVNRDGNSTINVYYYQNVDLVANSKTDEVYDGTEKFVSGFTGAPDGADFSAITVGAKGTNAGTYLANFDDIVGTVDASGKYIVNSAQNGELIISPVTQKVTIKVTGHKGGEKYNGKEQTVSGYDIDAATLPTGVSASDVKYNATASVSATNAGEYAMGLKDTQFSLSGDAAKNYTNVKFEVADGKLTIGKRQVTLESERGHKNYDGKTLQRRTNLKVSGDGFVGSDGVLAKEKLTWYDENNILPGTYENKFDPAYTEGTNLNNYDVTLKFGELVVNARSDNDKYEITVTANSDTQTYSGTEYSISGLTGTTFTNDKGATFTVEGLSASVSGADAGEYANKVTGTAVVKDAQGNDVTSQFNVKTEDGKLTINKREVTIKPKNASKVYDGNALVATDWEVADGSFVNGQGIANPKYTGSQTAPGTSESVISEWGYQDGTNANNYNIKTQPGTLNVTSRGATQTITVEANSTDATYDGNEHSAEGLKTNEFEVDGKKYTVSGLATQDPKATDAGTYTNNITGTAKVTDAQGNDVTSEFKVETVNGALTIAKADVTITPKDASKPYDGQPLTATDFTATGFVGNDTVANVVYGGSQTEAGTSESSIKSYEAAEGTNLNNYNITKGNGTLEVTASQKAVIVKVEGNTNAQKYDGTEKNASGFTVAGVTVDGQESTLYGAVAGTDFVFNGTATAARTDAGTTNMGLAADQFANVNKNFASVTFEVVEDGSVTVAPREVTLTSATDEKPYDGTALTNSNVTVSGDGFAQGEGFTAHVTGSQTNAGSSDNTFTYELTEGTNANNYQIATSNGTLTVKPISDPITVTIVGDIATGTYNGKELKAEGYNFSSTNNLFTQDKVAFSGTAEAARTDAGKTSMGLTAAQFINDDTTNFTNVTFEVTDGYVDIAKADVTLKSADLTKFYDGTALVNGETALATDPGFAEGEGATYTFTGSQTVVGSSANAFSYTLNDNTKAYNYNIAVIPGTLTVTNRDAKYQITVKANSDTAIYDGKQHSVSGVETNEFTVEGNTYTVSGLTTENPTQTNAGAYSNNIIGTAVVKDAQGNDVSSQFEVTTENGSLVIDKAKVTMKSASDGWTYDGNEHTKHEMESVTGFAEGEGATFTYTGAITNVGEAKNTYTYTLNANTSVDNYIFSEPEYGTLTVNPVTDKVTVTIKGTQETKTYNGSEQFVTGYDFSANNGLYTQSNVKFTGDAIAKGTAVGPYNMNLAKEQFSNTSNNFSNVEFVVEDGWLKIDGGQIDQNSVVWNTHDNQKVYEGTPLAAYAATATDKYGNALNVEYSIDGETWTSDPSQITITHFGYQDVQLRATGFNYADGQYATSSESIAITKRLVTLTSANDTKTYDGKPLTNNVVTATPKGKGVGFVDGEGVSFNVTGSQTEKGESDNTFTYSFIGDTKGDDYKVTTQYGKLIVTADDTEVVVTITEHSGSFEYDGTEKSVSGYDFKASNELYKKTDFTFSGNDTIKGTNVGTYDMELKSSDFTNNSQNFSKVTFVIVDGQLSITSKSVVTDKDMTVEAPRDVTYNGQPQQEKPVVKDGDKTLTEGIDYTLPYSSDTTNVGTVIVTVTGKGNYSGSVDVTYQILKRSVILTSENGSKPYDGTALTRPDVTVAGDGFVEGEVTNIRATGTVTTVAEGEVTNTIVYDEGANFKEDNYNITKDEGKLSITALSVEDGLTITPNNVEYTYNAQSHSAGAATATASVAGTNVSLEYRVKGSPDTEWRSDVSEITAINAGTVTIEVRASAPNYSGYKYADQTLTINKRDVELTSASASKVYDGTALSKDWVDMGPNRVDTGFIWSDLAGDGQIHATGSQTAVGTSNNTISYQLKEGAANNYNILPNKLGTLEVTAQSIVPDPDNPDTYKGITISDPSDHVYDGKAHKWAPTVRDAEGNELVEDTDYTVSYDTDDFTNVTGIITVTITGIGNYTGTATRTYQITPKGYSVVTGSASKVYDGTPLLGTDAKVTPANKVDGLVNSSDATFTITGSQTEVGSSDNTYELKFASDQMGKNYKLESEQLGKLTVTENAEEIVVTTTGGTFTYDGQAHGATSKLTSPLPAGYTLDKIECTTTVTNVADSKDDVGPTTLIIRNAKGEDVTNDLNINYVNGSITITPASLTVTTGSASKYYDGTPLTNDELKVDGLIKGDSVSGKTTGTQTDIGQSDNTYELTWPDDTTKKNYEVAVENLGKLTVYAYVPPTPTPEPGPGPTPPTPEPPTPGPEPTPTPTPTPEPTPEPTPATPDTPTTPDAPVAPTTPTTPADTATSSNPVVDTAVTTLENVYEAVTGDEVQPEEKIYDSENPLGTEQAPHCWVHWYMLVFMVLTAIYGAGVCVRRRNFTRRLEDDMNAVLKGDEKATPGNEAGKEE